MLANAGLLRVVLLMLASAVSSCGKRAAPATVALTALDAAPAAAATLPEPLFVEIRGPRQNFSDLPTVGGVMIDHGAFSETEGTTVFRTYVASMKVVEAIRSRGLEVSVVQTAEEVKREFAKIARSVAQSGETDAARGPR